MIEIIDGIKVDWSKFKGNINNKRSKNAYIHLCKLLDKNKHKLLSDYIGSQDKSLIKFDCEHEPSWIAINNYKKGHGCPKCGGTCPDKAREDFFNMLEANGHKILSEYINAREKVLIDFGCGHEHTWIIPNSYKQGNRCYKCSGRCSEQAKIDFINMIKDNGHELLSEYVDAITKVKIDFKCSHGPSWVYPHNYKNGVRCHKCAGNNNEQAKEEFAELVESNGHKLLSEYIKSDIKVLIDYNCGHEAHWIIPDSYRQGTRCPLCKNKGEAALYDLLLSMFENVETQKKYEDLKDKDYLRYDFYIPEYNLLIELDGDHHRQEVIYNAKNMTELEMNIAQLDATIKFLDRKRKDKLKDEYAANNDIPLLRIEYNNSKIELDKWKKLILDKIEDIEIERAIEEILFF